MIMVNQLLSLFIIFILIGLITYFILYIDEIFKTNDDPLIEAVNNLLPQTQCGQCGYPGCKPYATAISKNETTINRCPPGGIETIDALANLLNLPNIPLAEDLSHNNTNTSIIKVAKIKESECIGCLLCIKACPVDAIVGANKLMHTVITDQCTGCELCVAPCPMNCIDMVEHPLPLKYYFK